MSAQKSVQVYLDKHDIGKLFEDMMAKLIMEMPIEPINYLIKLLNKVQQRKNSGNTYPSAVLSRPGMSLTGSSIPLKQSKDPQIVLPGSKSLKKPWLDESGVRGTTPEGTHRSHSYEKPWLTGSKLLKTPPVSKSEHQMETNKIITPISWDTTKSKTVDSDEDIIDEMISPRKSTPRQERSSSRLSTTIIEKSSRNKENLQTTNNISVKKLDSGYSSDDELKVQPVESKVPSPQLYSKFRNKQSRNKSTETNNKRQLIPSTIPSSGLDTRNDSDYEGDHLFEDEDELRAEGVKTKPSTGVRCKRPARLCTNVSVSVCVKCAQVIDGAELSSKSKVRNIFSDTEDFASVSQVSGERTYRITEWSPAKHQKPGQQENLEIVDAASDIRSDFFEQNDPLKDKAKSQAVDLISETGSTLVQENPETVVPKEAWQQEVESGVHSIEEKVAETNGGWKQQKVAKSEVMSEVI